jgi:ABC-type nickel/cobalt efflux system permease component RcnA
VIVIGAILLVLAALGVIAAVVTGGDVNVHLSGFGVDSTTTVLWVFCAGALTMLFLALAWSSFRRAARRARMHRRELKQLRAEEATAADNRASHREVDDGRDLDVRDRHEHADEPSPAHVGTVDDGHERRYVAGEDRY